LLKAGAPRRKPRPKPHPVWKTADQDRVERQLAEQAETAYRRFVADWQATGSSGARARHRGAHQFGRQSGKQRGRPEPPRVRP
jgi:hypothetical protein